MARLYTAVPQQSQYGQGSGSLANIYKPGDFGGYINVTEDFPWTVSYNIKKQAGRIILKEFEVNETTLKRQANFYLNGIKQFQQALTPAAGSTNPALQDLRLPNILEVYRELYPKDKPTGFTYDFPYFDEINFQVTTPQWASLDTLEQLAKGVGSTVESVRTELKNYGDLGEFAAGALEFGEQAIQVAGRGGGAALGFLYPKVGILDRPRIWETHYFRDINISIPLYNTLASDDWTLNRELCELLVNQNLYNKRDIITGIPPVFYEVLVIGQHYSWASCVTNLTIYNRGNVRILQKDLGSSPASRATRCNVPDVYELNMTLTDLVIPSKNQFQAINNPTVVAGIVSSEQTILQDADPTQSVAQGILQSGQQLIPAFNFDAERDTRRQQNQQQTQPPIPVNRVPSD